MVWGRSALRARACRLKRVRKNPFPCHSERSEESRSGLFSRQCEIPRRLRLLRMTAEESFPRPVNSEPGWENIHVERNWPTRILSKQRRQLADRWGGALPARRHGGGGEPSQAPESPGDYKVKWYEFTEHKISDTCWSLSVGPDGRIYAAACAEGVPGGIVKVVRYNEAKDGLDYLFDVDRRWWMTRAIPAGPRNARFITASRPPCTTAFSTWQPTSPALPLTSRHIPPGFPGTTRSVASAAARCWLSTPRPTR